MQDSCYLRAGTLAVAASHLTHSQQSPLVRRDAAIIGHVRKKERLQKMNKRGQNVYN